jgi:hypothetical protein
MRVHLSKAWKVQCDVPVTSIERRRGTLEHVACVAKPWRTGCSHHLRNLGNCCCLWLLHRLSSPSVPLEHAQPCKRAGAGDRRPCRWYCATWLHPWPPHQRVHVLYPGKQVWEVVWGAVRQQHAVDRPAAARHICQGAGSKVQGQGWYRVGQQWRPAESLRPVEQQCSSVHLSTVATFMIVLGLYLTTAGTG